ncbi:MAG TPA: hypothetical protein VLK58_14300 [Conexibacter sp.]|nr:hypothetical protein [Conexibacter sp.]
MSESHPLVVRLELARTTDPIAGTLSGPDGTERAFRGWTGLAAALGRVAEESVRPDPPESHVTSG